MDTHEHPHSSQPRRSSSTVHRMYRRDSNMSKYESLNTGIVGSADRMRSSSIVSDVEMAREDVFAGPMSESVPSSTTGFAHRSRRADSVTSFTYFQEEGEAPDWTEEDVFVEDRDSADGLVPDHGSRRDLENASLSSIHRQSSRASRYSADQPLLRRSDSKTSTRGNDEGENFSQKLHIVNEDLTIVIAGFRTSFLGLAVYMAICIVSLGLAYLVFRWLPRWRIKVIGAPTRLKYCSWVVVEVSHWGSRTDRGAGTKAGQNQWGELTVYDVRTEKYQHPLSTVFGLPRGKAINDFHDDDDPTLETLRVLDYRYLRLLYQPVMDKFVLNSRWTDPQWTDTKALRHGLDADERDMRDQVFGKNVLDIHQKPVAQILVDEAFHPFYVFQVASLILWSMEDYYYYACAIFIISVFSITTTVVETRFVSLSGNIFDAIFNASNRPCEDCESSLGLNAMFALCEMDSVRLLHGSRGSDLTHEGRSVSSSDLVPGDVYELSDPSLTQLPADSLLLAGDSIMNESMLTGESIPVSKIPIVDEALSLLDLRASSVHPILARHFLFCGTKIIRARRPQHVDDDEAVALAMVVRTGFNTTKGALVRSMLFPKPLGFEFYRDSFRYISVMACVAAIGFVASFVNLIQLGMAWQAILICALDLITIVVPPALPATLSIGTNFALSRLRNKGIFCISPQRVNISGKLDVVCFDKTGTLTEDGLDVLGIRLVQHPEIRFSDLLLDAADVLPPASYERDPTVDYRINKQILYTMATCHSLRLVDGEYIGDPLDLKMFGFTGWSFDEGDSQPKSFVVDGENHQAPIPVARPPPAMAYDLDDYRGDEIPQSVELGILRSFEFAAHLRRASVIVRQRGDPGAHVFVKGAPEVMKDICQVSSIPTEYDDLISYYTHRGFRVIACASKFFSRLSSKHSQEMGRIEAESRLQLVGFIIFENKLKEATAGAIGELNEAAIRNVMCTGDNILTAISVARECNLVNRNEHCFMPRFVDGDRHDPQARLTWESIDNSIYQLDESTLIPQRPAAEIDTSAPFDGLGFQNYSLAVTGDVFRWIVDYGSSEVMQRMLVKGQVFARMSPDEKHELVEKLQSIDYCCGFCGDGANDCGALKAASVGVSLSEAEASVAAPFTSRVFDISCVPELIREGRAALVTSFCCFKYMSLYSAIQFTSVSFLYVTASNLGDFQYLYIDLFLILPIAVFMGWTGAYPVLSRKRPTASLVSYKVLTPLLGQIALCIIIQAIAFQTVQQQSWYKAPDPQVDHPSIKNSDDTVLFLVSCYQYILSGVVLSVGAPFRQSMTGNVPFVVTIVVALLISLYMLFDPAEWLADLMDLTEMSLGFELALLVLASIGFVVAYVAERSLFPLLAKRIWWLKKAVWKPSQKKRKRYKEILEDMMNEKE